MNSSSIESLNPQGYPLEQAFQAMDYYAAMQNGEPQLFTFSETIDHYALINTSKQNAFPRRKPVFIESHNDIKEMVDQLAANAETSLTLDPHKQYLLTILQALSDGQEDLPLTTAEELEVETLESTGLNFETIREAAHTRTAQQDPEALPSTVMINAETGESRRISLDAATLIADGSLELKRERDEDYGSRYGAVRINTMVRLDKYLVGIAADLGLDTDNVALVDQARKKGKALHAAGLILSQPTHPILGTPLSVSKDIWSESGTYTPASTKPANESAPYRHLLNRDGLNYEAADDYDADDFLDAAQDVIDAHFRSARNLTGEKIVLQPIEPLELSLEALRQSVSEYKHGIFNLGYCVWSDRGYGTELFRDFKLVFGSDGSVAKSLAFFGGLGGSRIDLENAAVKFERLRTPMIKRLAHYALRKS